jgi:hypothetical protein
MEFARLGAGITVLLLLLLLLLLLILLLLALTANGILHGGSSTELQSYSKTNTYKLQNHTK